MLCNNAVECGEEDEDMKVCEIRGHLPTQETAVNTHTEAVDFRALGARELSKTVDKSDNSHKQKGKLFYMLSKYRAHLRPSQAFVNYFNMK